jgi:cytochrome P450
MLGMTSETSATHIGTAALRTLEELPGPRGVPLLGNLLELDPTEWHVALERWAHRYGPMVVYRVGTRPFLLISDPELARTVFRSRPDTFRRLSSLTTIIEEILGPFVFTAEGDAWRGLRSLVVETLSTSHQRSFFPTLRRAALRLQEHWGRFADAGCEVDVQADLMRFAVDCTTSLAFGIDMNTIQGESLGLGAKLERIFPAIMRRLTSPFPYWRWVSLPEDRRLNLALREVRVELDTWIEGARTRLSSRPDGARNFLEAMLLARDERGRPYSDDVIAANALGMLVAGEDTTANSISWAVHHLCERGDLLARLREEADAALGEGLVAGSPEQVNLLTFAGAVASEALRVRPVAAWHSYEASVDTVLDGVIVPRATPVVIVTRPTLARGCPAEAEGVEVFDPERWLGPEASSARRADFAFGDGPRICPGRSLAFLEMRLALSMLAGSFEVERAGDADRVRETTRFTMVPDGLRVRLRRRRSGAGAAT